MYIYIYEIYIRYIHANHSRYFTIFNISWTFHSFTLVHGGKHRSISPLVQGTWREITSDWQISPLSYILTSSNTTLGMKTDVFSPGSDSCSYQICYQSFGWYRLRYRFVLLFAQAEWMNLFILMLSYLASGVLRCAFWFGSEKPQLHDRVTKTCCFQFQHATNVCDIHMHSARQDHPRSKDSKGRTEKNKACRMSGYPPFFVRLLATTFVDHQRHVHPSKLSIPCQTCHVPQLN